MIKWCGFAASFEGHRQRRRSDPRNEGGGDPSQSVPSLFCEAAGFLCDRRWVAKARILHLFSQNPCLSGAACSTAAGQRRHSFCICFRKNCAGAGRIVRPPSGSDGTAFAFVFAKDVPERAGLCDHSGDVNELVRAVIVGVYSGLAGVVLVFLSVF